MVGLYGKAGRPMACAAEAPALRRGVPAAIGLIREPQKDGATMHGSAASHYVALAVPALFAGLLDQL